MRLHRQSIVVAVMVVVAVLGCGSGTTTEPTGLSIAGNWSGVAQLSTAVTATMQLQQRGSTITGSMTVGGAFPQGLPLTGVVDASSLTFEWKVANGCEQWSGALTVAAGSEQMDGTAVILRSTCPPAQAAMGETDGTLALTKQ
jgi:hypothetical protein